MTYLDDIRYVGGARAEVAHGGLHGGQKVIRGQMG